MIKEIFFPEYYGKKRYISKTILSLAVTQDQVFAAQVYAKSKHSQVQKLLTQTIEQNQDVSEKKRTVTALKKIIEQVTLKDIDQIRIALPSSMVIFKELQFPFVDREKIRLVLRYEVESMLPFDIDQAVIDFIVTDENKEQNSASVLVAVAQREDLDEVLALYHDADIDPDVVTIDLFAFYSLYHQIPEYADIAKGSALVDVGMHSTRVAFLQNGKIRLTRYIQRGLATVAQHVSKDADISVAQVLSQLKNNSFPVAGQDSYARAVHKHFINFFNEIQFTLNSFSLKLNFYEGVNMILFLGKAYEMKNVIPFAADTLQITCQLFDWQRIFQTKAVKNKTKMSFTQGIDYSLALGSALSTPNLADFNLRRDNVSARTRRLIAKRAISVALLSILIVCVVGAKGFLQVSYVADRAQAIERREFARIKAAQVFSRGKFPKKPTLAKVVKEAERVVNQKVDLWAPFAKERMRPLTMLLELTRVIDKKTFDVTVTRVTINSDEGVTKGEVEGYFRSKTGSAHFTHFAELETRFKDSPFVRLTEQINAVPAEEKGVLFTVNVKQKEV